MKKGKKQTGKYSPYKDFKWVAIISGIIVSLIFAVFVLPILLFSAYDHYTYNQEPAKKLAAVMVPFAKDQHLKKLYEYNGARGIDNSTSWFLYIYQSDQSLDALHSLVEQYLEKKGYRLKSSLITNQATCSGYPDKPASQSCDPTRIQGFTINQGEPFWIFRASNSLGDEVSGEISDKTYYNYANGAGENIGEHSVPPGKTVLNISFTSHEKY